MRKLKVGLYFNNFGFSGVDLSNPELGNPGIGGTLFNFVTLPYYYSRHVNDEIEWYLIGPNNSVLPTNINPIHIDKPEDLSQVFETYSFDYFIWKPARTKFIIGLLEKYQIRGIAWCHNIPEPIELNQLAKSRYVKAVSWVGHEAMDVVRDHAIINKSTVIYNGFDPSPYLQSPNLDRDPNLVVYLGSLHPAKCFHLLAQAWPKVLEKRPNAKLVVIGSGKLYNRNCQLGPFELAEESYERVFTAPLLDEEGKIDKSIHFAGLLGSEKIPIMKSAAVGVINPHGKSEVCPGSAIEFQACGTPVVAGARYGNLDVIIDKETGYLVNNQEKLVEKICKLLNSPESIQIMGAAGKSFIEQKFSQKKIMGDWKSLFERLEKNEVIGPYPMKSNWSFNMKIVFELLRVIKFKIGIFRNLPSIYEFIESRKNK
ncbi:glycosyltransferase family 4 protein [Marinoscillum pacificum]|uniref:glycosyltransferase family 4 protein n=1 Tax=Marinoscillum pacificum TaxID=392723 RepID=UPI002157DE2A|nr:glycosyltransferase family 4 protein [Marinoscillum pacificum]